MAYDEWQEPQARLKGACNFLLFGCLLGFVGSLTMLAVPGRREHYSSLRSSLPCHPFEDASSPLPLCKRAPAPSAKAKKVPDLAPISPSAVREELEQRQRRMEKAKQAMLARDEAEREAVQQASQLRREAEQDEERQHQELLRKQSEFIEQREGSFKGSASVGQEVEAQRRIQDTKPGVVAKEKKEDPQPTKERPPCHTAEVGEPCYRNVVWSMHKGFHEHPEWYPGLSAKSTFAEFQYVLNLTGSEKQRCPMPCLPKKERRSSTGSCRTASPGEDCYKQALWAKMHGVYEHPEWYGRLDGNSSFEAFQEHLRKGHQADCPKPCSPSLQLQSQ